MRPQSAMNSFLPPYFRVMGARHLQEVLVKRNERSLVRTRLLSVFRPSWVYTVIAHMCGTCKENLALQVRPWLELKARFRPRGCISNICGRCVGFGQYPDLVTAVEYLSMPKFSTQKEGIGRPSRPSHPMKSGRPDIFIYQLSKPAVPLLSAYTVSFHIRPVLLG